MCMKVLFHLLYPVFLFLKMFCYISGKRKYKCEHCGKALCSAVYLRDHIKSVHTKVYDFKCDQCEKSFSALGKLKQHIQFVHEKQRNHLCDICNKAFQTPRYLRDHIAAVHQGIRKFACEFCGKYFGISNMQISNTIMTPDSYFIFS